jgi:long-subunit fatty acid transport protein
MIKKIVVILILLPFISNAQVVSDAKQWTSISVSKKINKFKFSLGEDIRFDENISHLDKFFTELGAQYKITKGFYVGLNYRYSRNNDYETSNYNMYHRIDFALTYKVKLDKFRFSFRTKFQTKKDLPEENNPTFNRNKFTINYKLDNPITPFVSYEFYYQFNDEKIINRSRISLGSKYAINDNNTIKLFYLYENRFNTRNLRHNHIWGVSYSIEL